MTLRRASFIASAALFACHSTDVPATPTDSNDSSETATTSTTSDGTTSAQNDSPNMETTEGFVPFCGDGIVAGDEYCDDGNTEPGDGCEECIVKPVVDWSLRLDGPAHLGDSANDVAFAPDGSIFVVGDQESADSGDGLSLRKFDPGGALLWERTLEGKGFNPGLGIAVDDEGGVLVVGLSADLDFATSSPWVGRYNSEGKMSWTFSEEAPFPGFSYGSGIRTLGGWVFVVSTEQIAPDTSQIVLRRLDRATGAEQWQKEYIGKISGLTYANGLALDPGGGVIVVGAEAISASDRKLLLLRWGDDGELVATASWSDPTADIATAMAATVLPAADIAVLAQVINGTQTDVHLLRFTREGSLIFDKAIVTAPGANNGGGIAVDAEGLILVAGGIRSKSGEGFLGVYNDDGEELLSQSLDGGSGLYDRFQGIAVHPTGVVLVGRSMNGGAKQDAWIVKILL